jgi:hypothetical protein
MVYVVTLLNNGRLSLRMAHFPASGAKESLAASQKEGFV